MIEIQDSASEAAALAKVEEWCAVYGQSVPPRTVRRRGGATVPAPPKVPASRQRAGTPFLPPLRDEDDLSLNAPGAGLESMLLQEEQSHNIWVRLVAKVTRNPLATPTTLLGLEGERIVGAALEPLRASGWKVLHGVPLPSGSDIDHVVIGPPGVFTINTKHHPDATVRVGDKMVSVNRNSFPYLANAEFEASRTTGLLEEWCGFEVPVHPVIAVVGARKISHDGASPVLVVAGEQIASNLPSAPTRLTPRHVDMVFRVARHRQVWSRIGSRHRKAQ
ncbi:nuclease-related domain-containing protein [Streptomyces sp. CB01881]|uniref:nuclease-related domain-containing protein n=1 Tax=Streptomyces sp. CB01881 TaxID=2078691 RepID=UPI0011E033D4|nr:nuclease-related domain-containing protein [Streptomyces sp. CB01881]TYC71366.1 NERD domain-containing protein [Streptomyces sp. CB01881]